MREVGLGNQDLEALARDILGQGKTLRFRAVGTSMWPFIQDGDVIEVHPVDERISRGDIILFVDNHQRILAHRVIRVQNHETSVNYVTKGDALVYNDGNITKENVLGRVTAVEREGHFVKRTGNLQRFIGVLWGIVNVIIRWSTNLVVSLLRPPTSSKGVFRRISRIKGGEGEYK